MNNDEANALIDEYREQKAAAYAAGMPLHPNLTEARKSAAIGMAKHFIDLGADEFADISIDGQKVRFEILGLKLSLTTESWRPESRTLAQLFHHAEHLLFSWLDEVVSPHVNRSVYHVNQFASDFHLRHRA